MGFENCGRRPKPTALHVLNGNPSRKKLNENEPCPPSGDLEKPRGLSQGAGLVWDELLPVCVHMRTVTVADLRTFAKLCELEASFIENVQLKGTEHFDWRKERDLANGLRPYYELFGLSAVARARISLPKQDEPVSKWAGIK